MRVVHVIPSVARSAGGPSEVVRELLPELERQGIDVRLVTTDKEATPEDRDILDRSNVVTSKSLMARWTFAPAIAPVLWREIGDADIVHVHSIHTFPSTIAMLIARLRQKPVVLQPHGALNKYHIGQRRALKIGYLKVIDGVGLRAVRAALYSSQMEIAEASAVLPRISAERLPLGIDKRILEATRTESDPPRVLFLARLAKKKRLDLLLEALSESALAGVNLEAVIAGPVDGDLDYSPETMIDELGETRTKLVGQVGPELRAALLSSATVYVLPSDDESFGMSVAEAMAAGCAVVCSPFVGVASDAQSSGAAVIVNQDPALLAESIQGLLASPETRRELGVRARQYASENLTWPSIGDRLASYYAKAAGAVT